MMVFSLLPVGLETCVRGELIVGGSGVSFAVSHLLQVIRDAKAGKPHPRQFSIIWMVKSRRKSSLTWVI